MERRERVGCNPVGHNMSMQYGARACGLTRKDHIRTAWSRRGAINGPLAVAEHLAAVEMIISAHRIKRGDDRSALGRGQVLVLTE